MMPINYDPDGKPDLTDEMIRDAEQFGLRIVNVICDEPGARVGDATGISFLALVHFIPSRGDFIDLEDGRSCEVKYVRHKVAPLRDSGGRIRTINLVPNVVARLISHNPHRS